MKERFKKIMVYFCVLYRVYTNIPKLYGLLVYYVMDFLGHGVLGGYTISTLFVHARALL